MMVAVVTGFTLTTPVVSGRPTEICLLLRDDEVHASSLTSVGGELQSPDEEYQPSRNSRSFYRLAFSSRSSIFSWRSAVPVLGEFQGLSSIVAACWLPPSPQALN
jgi:hypothetical protein